MPFLIFVPHHGIIFHFILRINDVTTAKVWLDHVPCASLLPSLMPRTCAALGRRSNLSTHFFSSMKALVIARKSGAVSVCDVAGLRNMLGDSPEFLAGVPQVQTVCLERGFMGLECETELVGKNDEEFSDGQAVSKAALIFFP